MYENPKAVAEMGIAYLEAAILEVMGSEMLLMARRLTVEVFLIGHKDGKTHHPPHPTQCTPRHRHIRSLFAGWHAAGE